MRRIGDICKIVGLTRDSKLNGTLCEILTPLAMTEVPEADGVTRKAMRYGIRVIGIGSTGYARPENLSIECTVSSREYAAFKRAANIHNIGTEEPETPAVSHDVVVNLTGNEAATQMGEIATVVEPGGEVTVETQAADTPIGGITIIPNETSPAPVGYSGIVINPNQTLTEVDGEFKVKDE